MDYKVLPDTLINYMADNGTPLSESQEMVLYGAMTGMQQLIEAFGLEALVAKQQVVLERREIER